MVMQCHWAHCLRLHAGMHARLRRGSHTRAHAPTLLPMHLARASSHVAARAQIINWANPANSTASMGIVWTSNHGE
jgi:hypothetical protein